MYSSVFQIGWMKVNAEGDTPAELIREVEKVQDLQCLIQMAGSMGTKKDKQGIRKHHTKQDGFPFIRYPS